MITPCNVQTARSKRRAARLSFHAGLSLVIKQLPIGLSQLKLRGQKKAFPREAREGFCWEGSPERDRHEFHLYL